MWMPQETTAAVDGLRAGGSLPHTVRAAIDRPGSELDQVQENRCSIGDFA